MIITPYKNPADKAKRAKERYNERKDAGICVICKSPPISGRLYCKKHEYKNRYSKEAQIKRNEHNLKQYHKKRKDAGIVRTPKLTDEERKVLRREQNKKWRLTHRSKVLLEVTKTYGDACALCGTNGRVLVIHQKRGIPHKCSNGVISTMRLARKDPTEWVRLCTGCHKAVHWCMQHFEMRWEEIETKFI